MYQIKFNNDLWVNFHPITLLYATNKTRNFCRRCLCLIFPSIPSVNALLPSPQPFVVYSFLDTIWFTLLYCCWQFILKLFVPEYIHVLGGVLRIPNRIIYLYLTAYMYFMLWNNTPLKLLNWIEWSLNKNWQHKMGICTFALSVEFVSLSLSFFAMHRLPTVMDFHHVHPIKLKCHS